MRIGLYLALLFSGVQSLAVAQLVADKFTLDFLLGERIGQCLEMKCAIFRGTILTDLPKPSGKIAVSVDEMLYGLPAGTTQLEVPYRPNQVSKFASL